MTDDVKDMSGIDTVELFLAHALTLENEAADGYQEIGDSMAVHNNPEVAGLFFQMAKYGRMHADEVKQLAERPRTAAHPAVGVLLAGRREPGGAIDGQGALHDAAGAGAGAGTESRTAGPRVLRLGGASTTNPRIRELATQFASEEAEHVRLLGEWIGKYPPADNNWDFDPDPPAMPE